MQLYVMVRVSEYLHTHTLLRLPADMLAFTENGFCCTQSSEHHLSILAVQCFT